MSTIISSVTLCINCSKKAALNTQSANVCKFITEHQDRIAYKTTSMLFKDNDGLPETFLWEYIQDGIDNSKNNAKFHALRKLLDSEYEESEESAEEIEVVKPTKPVKKVTKAAEEEVTKPVKKTTRAKPKPKVIKSAEESEPTKPVKKTTKPKPRATKRAVAEVDDENFKI